MKRVLVLTFFVFISILIAYGIISTVIPPSISQTSYQTIQLRRDTTANWTSANPILAQGEFGYDTTLKKLKIGDGISHWVELDYITLTPTEIEDLFPTFSYSLLRTGDDVTLYGDEEYPGNSKLYGTNGSGTKGWYSQTYPTALNFQYSITQSGINVNLVNDSASPGNEKYYGTDSSGAKGYSDFPSLGTWSSYDPYTPFGSGSDGDVTISSNTTLSDSTVGVKVLKYNNLTVNSGIYLEGHANDKVLVILVKGTLTLNGTIRMNGRGGGGAPGGSSLAGGGAGSFGGGGGGDSTEATYYGPSGGGGFGQVGQAGTYGTPGTCGQGGGAITATYPFVPTLPFSAFVGQGGNSNADAVGSNGTNVMSSPLTPLPFEIIRYFYGSGGGCGASPNVNTNAPGGAGGGVIWIEANNIIWGGSGLISCNGVNGTAGSSSSRGGGGAGAGGFAQVVYKTKSGSSTFQMTGGTGGAAGGVNGKAGGNGANGIYGEFQVR